MKKLILFDIDGTLVLTGRAGVRALDRALSDVLGKAVHGRRNPLDGIPIAGRTDRAIITDALNAVGVGLSEELVLMVRDAYCAHLPEEVDRDSPHPKLVLPGVVDALDALAPLEARGDVAVGLLTGNFARGAEIKLGYFDLWRRFRFGAFGDHHVNRRDLVPLAIEAADHAGAGRFALTDAVIVGDTPADVDCAHAHGAKAIAVATGGYDEAALAKTGADVVVADLLKWSEAWARLTA
jgi:phosphoglycolate phosphatase-like HAD superfamily hydrolase